MNSDKMMDAFQWSLFKILFDSNDLKCIKILND